MSASAQFLNASEAARRLGVSAKALRLYEQRGLLAPVRSAAGWRLYGPDQMARAAEIAALRALGLSLGQVARVLGGDAQTLEPALAAHQATLADQARRIAGTLDKVRQLRAELVAGKAPEVREIARLLEPQPGAGVCFELPWPWGGERFELRDIRPLTYIIGPLGSGKTRLAKRLSEALPGATFVGMERLERAARRRTRDLVSIPRSDRVSIGHSPGFSMMAPPGRMRWLPCWRNWKQRARASLVVDMLEQGLDKPTQEALIGYLRRRGPRIAPAVRAHAVLRNPGLGLRGRPTRPSSFARPITVRRSMLHPIRARQATRP